MESELRNDSHASSSPVAPILSDIEATAVQVALFRWHGAQLLKRPDGSPYYTSHLDELVFGKYLSPEQQREMLGKHYDMVINMAVRTAEIDERLVAATSGAKTGPLVEQVVLVGAGMDTRAWRLGLPPSCTIFEIDTMPDELKLQLLSGGNAPTCRRAFVRADLTQPGAMEAGLAAAGHDPSRPSYWVLEGLVGYLTRGAQEQLFKRLLALSAAGSWLLATAPPTPEYREDLAAKGFVLHHVTYETGADTLARVVAAGWGGGSGGNSSSGGNGSAKAAAGARLVSMHELCEKYRIQDLRILEFIVATSE